MTRLVVYLFGGIFLIGFLCNVGSSMPPVMTYMIMGFGLCSLLIVVYNRSRRW